MCHNYISVCVSALPGMQEVSYMYVQFFAVQISMHTPCMMISVNLLPVYFLMTPFVYIQTVNTLSTQMLLNNFRYWDN